MSPQLLQYLSAGAAALAAVYLGIEAFSHGAVLGVMKGPSLSLPPTSEDDRARCALVAARRGFLNGIGSMVFAVIAGMLIGNAL
jgi:hypothetical protein